MSSKSIKNRRQKMKQKQQKLMVKSDIITLAKNTCNIGSKMVTNNNLKIMFDKDENKVVIISTGTGKSCVQMLDENYIRNIVKKYGFEGIEFV